MDTLNQVNSYNRSSDYQVITSSTLIDKLKLEGYNIRSIQNSRVLNQDKQGFQKHIIRMQRDDIQFDNPSLKPELILRNSYDGSQSLRISLGIYRMVCTNGLTVGKSFQEYRVNHRGDAMSKVLSSLDLATKQFTELNKLIEKMSTVKLSGKEQALYAQLVASQLQPDRYVNSGGLLQLRRMHDKSNDLFTVLNVIQENALKGNYSYLNQKFNWTKARSVKSIDRTNESNNLVWNVGASLVGVS